MKLRHKLLLRLLVVATMMATVTNSPVWAATATLKPVADAGLYEDMPDVNQGAGGTMVSGTLRILLNRRAILRFDVASQIPPNATVTSASLTLNAVFKLPSGGGVSSTFDLHRVTQPWSESGVSWNQRMPGVAWGTPGGAAPADFSSTISASKPVSGIGTYVFGPSPNLTADIQAWVNNPGSNQGWILISESESVGKTARHFATKEDPANAATLVVEFTASASAPMAITSTSPLPSGTVGSPYSFTFMVTNGTSPFSWSVISGALPGGLSLSTAGVLSSTPTNAGTFNFTVQVADNTGATTNKAFTISINPPSLVIESVSPLPAGTVGITYSQTLAASGGQSPYNWSVTNGVLPGGFTLSSAGVLSGTPTNSGDFSFTVEVTDSGNVKTSKAFSLTINPPLRIGQASIAGNQIRFQFSAQGGQPYTVELNGSLSITNWQTLTNIAAQASAAVITVTDTISSGERYYRVRTP